MDRPLPNTYWVIPGRLLAGEHPYGQDEADARRRLERLLAVGIDYFIDLTERGEVREYRALLPKRSQYLRSEIPDMRTPQDLTQMQTLQARIRNALLLGRHIYIHCRAGIGRTGLVVGCYLAGEAADGAAALSELNRIWRQSERAETWPQVPQTAEQADYVRHWPPKRTPPQRTVRPKRAR